jgi:hypothetical protein
MRGCLFLVVIMISAPWFALAGNGAPDIGAMEWDKAGSDTDGNSGTDDSSDADDTQGYGKQCPGHYGPCEPSDTSFACRCDRAAKTAAKKAAKNATDPRETLKNAVIPDSRSAGASMGPAPPGPQCEWNPHTRHMLAIQCGLSGAKQGAAAVIVPAGGVFTCNLVSNGTTCEEKCIWTGQCDD